MIGEIVQDRQTFGVRTSPTSIQWCKSEQDAKDYSAKLLNGRRCRECGEPIVDSFCEPTKTQLNERQLCFSCNFWTEIEAEKEKHVFFDGKSYVIGEEPQPSQNRSWLGFGGSRWNILFLDGRLVITHNLWHQGTIPNHFRSRLPDTAKAISTDEAERILASR